MELGEALKNVEAEFKRWHFEQIKNYINVLDVAYSRITPSDKTKDDATREGETKLNRKQIKLTKEVRRGKEIHVDVYIMDISYEDETTPLS
jgi:hypothetical protein